MNKTPSVLKFDPLLAQAVGLNEAIVISQVEYWLNRKAKNDKYKIDSDGRKWTYNTYEEWLINFPFWSERTLRRTFINAENSGILLAKLQGRGKRARSKWYSLDIDKLNALLPEVMTGQVDQSLVETGQNGQFNSNRNGQIGHFAQAITKNTNTKNSFSQKDKVAPYAGEGAITAREIQLADSTNDMSSTIAELQNEFPSMSPEILMLNFKSQLNYWPKLNTSEVIKKTKARIYEQEINKKSGKAQRVMHTTGGAK